MGPKLIQQPVIHCPPYYHPTILHTLLRYLPYIHIFVTRFLLQQQIVKFQNTTNCQVNILNNFIINRLVEQPLISILKSLFT